MCWKESERACTTHCIEVPDPLKGEPLPQAHPADYWLLHLHVAHKKKHTCTGTPTELLLEIFRTGNPCRRLTWMKPELCTSVTHMHTELQANAASKQTSFLLLRPKADTLSHANQHTDKEVPFCHIHKRLVSIETRPHQAAWAEEGEGAKVSLPIMFQQSFQLSSLFLWPPFSNHSRNSSPSFSCSPKLTLKLLINVSVCLSFDCIGTFKFDKLSPE